MSFFFLILKCKTILENFYFVNSYLLQLCIVCGNVMFALNIQNVLPQMIFEYSVNDESLNFFSGLHLN